MKRILLLPLLLVATSVVAQSENNPAAVEAIHREGRGAAARQIKFIPGMKNGKFVPTWMQVEYHFNLY